MEKYNSVFDCLELDIKESTDFFGRFIFHPLNIGDGITIGNILRRVLLSNLPGISIVGVRIAGINHEFTTIPGVREDTLQISLNLKEVICKSKDPKETIGRLKVQGPAVITASDIKLSSDIEIINPNHYIATLSENYSLEMELMFNWGKGYTLIENQPIVPTRDLIKIDAIFMPVLHVSFSIETNSSEILGTHENLILDIRTNGSITPLNAISLASKIIIDWFKNIESLQSKIAKQKDESTIETKPISIEELNLSTKQKKENNIETQPKPIKKLSLSTKQREENNIEIKSVPIKNLNISTRTFNALKQSGINFIGELINYSPKDLKGIKNLGQKSIQEVIKALSIDYGLDLNQKKDDISNQNDMEIESVFIENLDLSFKQDEENSTDNKFIPIETLNVSLRTFNILKENGINFIEELINYSPKDLKGIKNLGQKSIQEVIKTLYIDYGFDLNRKTDNITNKKDIEIKFTPIENLYLSSKSYDKEKESNIQTISIGELYLSTKTFNALKQADINFIGELINYSPRDLKKIKNLGQKSIQEIVEYLYVGFTLELRID